MNEKLKNLNKKQFEKCLISLEMLTFETPKIYTECKPINLLAEKMLWHMSNSEMFGGKNFYSIEDNSNMCNWCHI